MTKKKTERYYVESFRETYPDFPSGTIIDSEEPDFIVENNGSRIGVEITELYREASPSTRPMQASERIVEDIVRAACLIHSARGGPALTVRVEFDLGSSKFQKARRREVASKLAEVVLATEIAVGGRAVLENEYDKSDLFPEEITRIRIQRSLLGQYRFGMPHKLLLSRG